MYEQKQLALQLLSDNDRQHIERLSKETATPIEEVQAVYVVERAKLQRMAILKTMLPVMVSANLRKQLKQSD